MIALVSFAGCATPSAESDSAAPPVTTDTKAAASDTEKKTDSPRERASATKAAAEPERAAPASTTRSDSRDDSVNSTSRLISQLNDATREIATLRAANAKLKAATPAPTAAAAREPDPVDVKLAASFKSYAQFKQELASVFADLDKLRADNASLNAKLKDAASGSQDAKATLAKLEGELKAEKTARTQAEQTAAKLRDQLRAVATAVSSAGLALDKVSTDSSASARLETSQSRLRDSPAVASTPRKHTVKEGDTLEKIADRYYKDPAKWRTILEANRGRLPLDGTLPSGLELEIPAK